MVLGVRVHGANVSDVNVQLDDLFASVPVPAKLGIPLLFKKLPGTGGDDSQIRMNVIVRFMADPDDGMAPPHWQYGGSFGPAPPVVLARRDKLPFSTQDWAALDEYMSSWSEALADAEDDRGAVGAQFLKLHAFRQYIRSTTESRPAAFLPLQFPIGSTVQTHGLSVAELNGQEGEVVQYSRERVGVKFSDRDAIALKPERLILLHEPPEDEPEAKRQDTGSRKEEQVARQKFLAMQEAKCIATRFCQCCFEDTFPERDDLPLFGIGDRYTARQTEVLAVWQGAIKAGVLVEAQVADALLNGTMRQLFEGTARDLAKSKTPNATYARDLVDANFAAMDWDDL